jgi:hypothetical protein
MVFNGGIGKEAQMLRRDILLVASAAVISSLLTYLACTTLTTPPEAVRYERSAANERHVAAPNKPADQPLQIRAETERLDAAKPLQQATTRPDGANRSDSSTAQDPALAFQKRQELGERFSSFFDGGGNPDSGAIGARIENRFYLEEWNQEWAGSKEGNIQTLFNANENLSGITPLQVTCRSRNCQVVLAASSQDQVRLLSEKFMRAATKNDLGMQGKVVAFFPDISTGRLVFYLSENGNTDLFN